MKLMIFEKGFNYSQDGPGNRLVYHLSGCNMTCPWCSNPEGMERKGKEYDTEEIISEIISSSPMFFDEGGVTFTGGECTLQSHALIEIINSLPDINFCIESNADTKDFFAVAEKCDTVIVDYKSPDGEKLSSVCNADIGTVEKNIRKISENKHIHIRIPFIHGFNDDEKSINGFLKFFTSLDSDFDVEILPYHEYGKDKWKKIGKEYTVTDGYVSKETINKFIELMKENSIRVIKS